MLEMRWHGRGGQGAVTSAELVALAAISEEKYAQAFPSFGPERRGAPVQAFNRINEGSPVRVRSEVTKPDAVIVLDPILLKIIDVTSGLKSGGYLIVNTKRSIDDIKAEYNGDYKIAVLDAMKIAKEKLGVPITNTTMMGALIRVTGCVKMESVIAPLHHRFGRIAEKNIVACQTAYDQTVVEA
ncbi:MAG: pyruvate synthase [Chloroflexi bacterium]|jgi:pyruvate ferredoxin oxidoreductase gamma subunit|nr:pyruvate synthase [Chloroflexota bacterium]MBT7080699.1 pyruvate synthase [Chloroflexota bacterium]